MILYASIFDLFNTSNSGGADRTKLVIEEGKEEEEEEEEEKKEEEERNKCKKKKKKKKKDSYEVHVLRKTGYPKVSLIRFCSKKLV